MTPSAPHRAPWRDLLGPAAITVLAVAVLVGLGLWQLRRLAWKTALIATIAERVTAPPGPLPPEADWPELRPADYDYRHVRLTGTYAHDEEVRVFRSLPDAKGPARGVGYLVMTPLRLASGASVIVDRGFVPADRRDPASRAAGQIGGTVTVTGLMRGPEARNPFTPADDPSHGLFFTRDPVAIAAALRLARAAPFTVDADASPVPGGLPQGGETVLQIPNDHLSYALTWFGLAGAAVAVFAVYAGRRLRTATTAPIQSVSAPETTRR